MSREQRPRPQRGSNGTVALLCDEGSWADIMGRTKLVDCSLIGLKMQASCVDGIAFTLSFRDNPTPNTLTGLSAVHALLQYKIVR
jgi:hypothetical protein